MSENEDRLPQEVGSALGPTTWSSRVGTKARIGVVLVTVIGVFAIILAVPIESGQGTTIGGLAVLLGAALTFYSAKLTRDRTRDDERDKLGEQQLAREQSHQREVMRDLRSRFTSSTAQLADDAATIRLAGVYSLVSLADDWYSATGSTFASERDRQVCIDVLCAYLRRDTTAFYAKLREGETADRPDGLQAEERIVRAAVITSIRAHTTFVPNVTDDPSWTGADFDLTGAQLKAENLQAVDLDTALFAGANLTAANLNGCKLRGSNLDRTILREAFLGGAQLTGAHLNKAHLNNAKLDSANFQNARGRAADFTGSKGDLTDFRGARLRSAKFLRARLMGARFNGANLSDAEFEGAELVHACFDGATIDGADFAGVDLSKASFVDVVIRWDEPVWPDGQRPDHVTVAPVEEFPDPNDD